MTESDWEKIERDLWSQKRKRDWRKLNEKYASVTVDLEKDDREVYLQKRIDRGLESVTQGWWPLP